jgi:hypothetical protein
MEFQSSFAWKVLPEAAFVKNAVIDAHRAKHESVASGFSRGPAKAVWRISTKMAYTYVYARGQESEHATQGEGLHE